jgi:hypothetical protein
MARQVVKLSQVLMKHQTDATTAVASLVAADVMEFEDGFKLSIDPKVTEIRLSGAGFGQNKSVIGVQECAFSGTLPMRTNGIEGATGAGQCGKALGICGMLETTSDSDADSSVDRFIYTPSNSISAWKSGTFLGESGNVDSNGSLLRKVQNCMGNAKITLDFDNDVAKLSIDGKGALVSADTVGTQVTVTPLAVDVPSLKGATINFFGDSDYCLTNFELDLGNASTVTLCPSNANGLGQSVITDRAVKWTAKVYKDSAAIATTPLLAGTVGTISIAWGAVPNKITISTTSAQITKVVDGDQNGVETYELSGICVNNQVAVQFDCAVA